MVPGSELKNIVVLLDFQLVLLYYSLLHEGLDPNAFRCQDKNIDILGEDRNIRLQPFGRGSLWGTIRESGAGRIEHRTWEGPTRKSAE
jgi:hypothetical protein